MSLRFFIGVILKVVGILIPKNNRICFFITPRTTWDSNQQILYAKLKDRFDVIVVDGNKISKFSPFTSMRCYISILSSKVIIFDHSIPVGLSRSLHFTVNVWHGSPIKKIRGFIPERFQSGFLNYQSRHTHLSVANSYLDAVNMATALGLSLEQVINTGLPRNYYLTCTRKQLEEVDLYGEAQKLDEMTRGFKKVILWAPTYRGNSHQHNDPIQLTADELSKLRSYLVESNALFMVRCHKFSNAFERDFTSSLDNIVDISHVKNVNVVLRYVDILITDYSSVWVDFIKIKHDLILYCPDLEEYTQYQGFINDFAASTPGKVIDNFDAVLNILRNKENKANDLPHFYERFHSKNDDIESTIRTIEDRIKLKFDQ